MSLSSMGNSMLNLSRFRKLTPVLAIIAFAVVFCSPARPQGNTGRILGTVTDQTGGAIANATVTITDVQRGTSRTLTTDSSGEYVAPGLLPGTYTVRGEAKGFKVFDRRNLLLETGKDMPVDIVLQTGSANEVITVTEEVPLVDATSTTLGGTLSNQIINDLPLNGRNYQNLLTLRPGVMIYPGGGPWTQSTNGTRPESMSFLIDGLPNDEAFMGLSITNAAAVIGDAATLLPVDAIQEFNTQVNPPAEFGWKTGAITSVGLKSGTNELHGSAYAYGRSDAFDARNFFNHYNAGTLQPKIPVSLEQYGGTAGAYIIKDKLFWFGGYEAQTYSVGSNLGITVPTTVALPSGGGNGCAVLTTGNCVNSIPNAIADIQAQPGAVLNPESLALLGCPTTAPFGPCTGALFGSNHTTGTGLNPTYQNTNDSKNGLGKIDYHISERNNLSGSYFFGNDGLVGEDTPYTNSAFLTHVHSRAQAAAGSWAWTPGSLWANEVRFGYTRYTLSIAPGDQDIPASKYGLYTGVSNPIIGGLPSIVVGGFTAMGNFFSFPKFVGPDNTYDIIDQVSHTMGKHALKFGFQFRDIQVNQATWRRARGDIRFSSLEDFLEGNVHQLRLLATNSTPDLGSPARSLKQYGYAAFVQDDWRLTQRITLNLGLRYEYTTPPSEAHSLLGNFDPTLGMVQLGTSQLGSIYNGDHTNFAPRVGVAWDVTGKGTTIVRAGFGMAYELLTMNTFLSQQNTNNAPTLGLGVIPTGATIVVNGVATPGSGNIQTTGINFAGSALPNPWPGTPAAPFFPANSTSAVVCGDGSLYQGSPTSPCSILGMNRNYTTPFVSTWSLGVQHAFTGNLSLDANYVGNHGSNLTGIVDVNQANIQTGAPGAYTTKFPYLGFINMMGNYYRSNYDGLQLTFTGRDYHGFSFIAGYTYAHALDDMSFNWNQYLPQDSLHPGADYASSDFDIRNRFTLSLTYQIPGKDSWGQMLKGWQVNSIITLQSGQPWNVIDYNGTYGFSQSGEGTDRWDFFGNPADFHSDGTHGIPCYGLGPGSPCPGTIPQACLNAAAKVGPMAVATLTGVGLPASSPTGPTGYCYMAGSSVMIPNAYGAFGTMGRNIFRATGFHNVDFSVTKAWTFRERVNMQFRAEFFNLFNHPNFANPWGGTSGYGPAGGYSDPTVPGNFGCGCATPDVAAVNPVLGSGSARAIQLGLKFTF